MEYEKVFAGLRLFALARLLTQLLSLGGTVLVARALGSDSLGQFALAMAFCGFAGLVFEGGFAEALIQRPPADARATRAMHTSLACAGVIVALAVAALAGPVSGWLRAPSVAPLLVALAASVALSAFSVVPYARLARTMQFGMLAGIDAVQSLVVTATSVALALSGHGVWALVMGVLAGSLLRAISLHMFAPGSLRPCFDQGPFAGYLRFGGAVTGDAMLWLAFTSADTFLLGRWAGTTQLGFYRVGQDIANLALEKVSSLVNQIALPAFSELSRGQEELGRVVLEAVRSHAVVGFSLFWGLGSVADLLVPVALGDEWRPAILPLMAFAWVAPLRLMGSIESPAMTGMGRPEVLVRTKLFLATVMIGSLAVACAWYGVVGAIFVWVVVFPVCYVATLRVVLSALDLTIGRAFQVVRGPLCSGLIMVVAVRALLVAVEPRGTTTGLLGVAIIVGALVYIGALRVLDPLAFSLTAGRLSRVAGLQPGR